VIAGVARLDSLPEGYPYADNGCDVHPRCLSCPLPECKFVQEEGKRGGPSNRANALRNAGWLRQYEAGISAHLIALEVGVTERTVQRGIASAREGRRGS